LIIFGILLIGCRALFATDETPEGWTIYKDGRFTLMYAPDTNLKKLEARIRSRYFSVSSAERDLYTNPAYDIEKRIASRLELIFLRAEQILAMYPAKFSIKIKVFRNRIELSEEYFRIFNADRQYKSFYVHSLGTIYTSMQDVSDSKISHEMGHAIIDNYFAIIPPPKVAELLAVYVDSHLEEE
jgi:hypothetical protein